ncbi:MAG: phage holin family protein [bacterium]|nr:phage holin family protein [bacterium]
MKTILNLVLQAVAVYATAYIIPSVHVADAITALIVALLLAVVNTILKPVLILLTLPVTIITLGLFTFVINALLVLLVDRLVAGFSVDGFLTALIFSFIVSFISSALNAIFK